MTQIRHEQERCLDLYSRLFYIWNKYRHLLALRKYTLIASIFDVKEIHKDFVSASTSKQIYEM